MIKISHPQVQPTSAQPPQPISHQHHLPLLNIELSI